MKKILLLSVLALFCSCEQKYSAPYLDSEQSDPFVVESPAPVVEKILDYLPQKPGTILTYKIELGEIEPLFCEEVHGGAGNSPSGYYERRKLYLGSPNSSDSPKNGLLKIKISASEKNLIHLIVEEEDFSIYDNSLKCGHARITFGDFHAPEFFWRLDDDSCSEIMDKAYLISSVRTLLFRGYPGEKIVRDRSPESLLFKGVEPVPGLNISGLHFVRTVTPDISDSSGFDFMGDSSPDDKNGEEYCKKGFEEHTYFVKGKGMVYLEQKVEGKTSMIWRLVDSAEK